MNPMKPFVLSKVVDNDLCIGCGACVQACPNKALSIQLNSNGFLIATANENTCDGNSACLEVCPFNPTSNIEYKNEDALANDFLAEAPLHHQQIGRYYNLAAGYSPKYRETSSSGGIATYIYEKLFDKGIIDYLVTVGNSNSIESHYQYNIISKKNELLGISKTRYHPVTLGDVLERIKHLDGKIAISGVGCFIKAIRLAQNRDPALKEKIVFLVGIICGGVKSKFFTDYLASKAGATPYDYSKPEYRVKNPSSTALDYSFSCIDNPSKDNKTIKMLDVGDMWGTGLFKANACDYCDDITTELADISLGDAWLEPYNQDGLGNSVLIARTQLAHSIIVDAKTSGELSIADITENELLSAQQGNIRHRIYSYNVRLQERINKNLPTPHKRTPPSPTSIDTYIVQKLRRVARKQSLRLWIETRNAKTFEIRIKPLLLALKIATRISAEKRKLASKCREWLM